MEIKTYGDPVLRGVIPPLTSHLEVHPFIQDMIETMYDDDGIGLSANQVGLRMRFFVIGASAFDDDRGDTVFINPMVLESSDEHSDFDEGCLSVPGIRDTVSRPHTIKVKYLDTQGAEHVEEFTDLPARVFQHEFDHLEGIFFVERLSPIRKSRHKRKLKALLKSHSFLIKV
ncbi:MAG: peptide deformylase [Candidatus Neomarinimicrobiota bacterium]